MTTLQTAVMIGLAALSTQITRWAPFLLFRKKTPDLVAYLGTVLPSAIWGMLVVYCFKSGTLVEGSSGLAEALAAAFTIALQMWKKNMALTIAGGTFCYMALVRLSV
ncbi:branched-chain amino acid transporter permease [Mailhella massiliensis]|uniref:branched-chain amino acid transporter permease n=1 Tax=Mailhella massiliensis TaxID=1903261 RepID=UPI002355D3B3|nr:AzlD domain-containing protein [Mailhella massiliensis]